MMLLYKCNAGNSPNTVMIEKIGTIVKSIGSEGAVYYNCTSSGTVTQHSMAESEKYLTN